MSSEIPGGELPKRGFIPFALENIGGKVMLRIEPADLPPEPENTLAETPADVRINPNYDSAPVVIYKAQLDGSSRHYIKPRHGQITWGAVRVGLLKSEIDRAYDQRQPAD